MANGMEVRVDPNGKAPAKRWNRGRTLLLIAVVLALVVVLVVLVRRFRTEPTEERIALHDDPSREEMGVIRDAVFFINGSTLIAYGPEGKRWEKEIPSGTRLAYADTVLALQPDGTLESLDPARGEAQYTKKNSGFSKIFVIPATKFQKMQVVGVKEDRFVLLDEAGRATETLKTVGIPGMLSQTSSQRVWTEEGSSETTEEGALVLDPNASALTQGTSGERHVLKVDDQKGHLLAAFPGTESYEAVAWLDDTTFVAATASRLLFVSHGVLSASVRWENDHAWAVSDGAVWVSSGRVLSRYSADGVVQSRTTLEVVPRLMIHRPEGLLMIGDQKRISLRNDQLMSEDTGAYMRALFGADGRVALIYRDEIRILP